MVQAVPLVVPVWLALRMIAQIDFCFNHIDLQQNLYWFYDGESYLQVASFQVDGLGQFALDHLVCLDLAGIHRAPSINHHDKMAWTMDLMLMKIQYIFFKSFPIKLSNLDFLSINVNIKKTANIFTLLYIASSNIYVGIVATSITAASALCYATSATTHWTSYCIWNSEKFCRIFACYLLKVCLRSCLRRPFPIFQRFFKGKVKHTRYVK